MAVSTTEPLTLVLPTRYGLGLVGLLLGFIGLAAAIAGPYVAVALQPPAPPPRNLSDELAEAGEKLVGRFIDRARGKLPAPQPPVLPPTPWAWYFSVAAASLGLIGALAGTGAWVRREDHRLAGSAIAVGSLAVAWIYIVAALFVGTVIVVVLLVLSAVGMP